MSYKFRLVHLANGKCRIQKKHWFFTLGFWNTEYNHIRECYYEYTEKETKKLIKDNVELLKNKKIVKYEEIDNETLN